jgi:epoxide hydrolase-like predicted phosphatase
MPESHPTIKAVILDFGGVLMRTESQEQRERLARHFGLSLDELYRLVFDGKGSREAQLGLIDPDQRWAQIGQSVGLKSANEQHAFRQAMFATDVLDHELVDYVRSLRPRFKTALLSNASLRLVTTLSELHIEDCFDVIVISAQVGLMKPDPAIYRLTLDRLGAEPHEAVFLDDVADNVAAAARLGIHGVLFTGRDEALNELSRLLGRLPRTC